MPGGSPRYGLSEEYGGTEALKKDLDEIRADAQTDCLEGYAKVQGRRHRGETVRAAHTVRVNGLEGILKKAEANCSEASKRLGQTQSMVRRMSICPLW
jgi:hypothetical protein